MLLAQRLEGFAVFALVFLLIAFAFFRHDDNSYPLGQPAIILWCPKVFVKADAFYLMGFSHRFCYGHCDIFIVLLLHHLIGDDESKLVLRDGDLQTQFLSFGSLTPFDPFGVRFKQREHFFGVRDALSIDEPPCDQIDVFVKVPFKVLVFLKYFSVLLRTFSNGFELKLIPLEFLMQLTGQRHIGFSRRSDLLRFIFTSMVEESADTVATSFQSSDPIRGLAPAAKLGKL